MHLWPTPRRSPVVLVAVALLVTVASACSSESKSSTSTSTPSTRPAAVAGGADVPLADVTADLKAEAAAGKKGKTQTDPSSPLASPKGKKPGTYTPAATAAALTNRILFELYDQQLRSLKTKVASADKERARQSLCQDPTTGQVPSGSSCPPLAAYPKAYKAFLLSLRERELAYGKVLYSRVFDRVKRTKPAALKQVCLDLVQVADQATSDQIVKAMKGGTTIADASKTAAAAGKASSVQPGCLYIAGAPADLAKAKKDAIVPIKSQSAFGVAKVTSFKSATKTEFATQPPQSDTTVQNLVKGEVDRSIRRTKVTVLAKYGRWNASQLVVVVPKAKTTTTTTAPTSTTKPSPTTGASTTSSTAP